MKNKDVEEVSGSEDSRTTEKFILGNKTNLSESSENNKLTDGELKGHNENCNFNANQIRLTIGLKESETQGMASSNDFKSDEEDSAFVLNNSPKKKLKTKLYDDSISEGFADTKSTFAFEELTSDDEIYTFQCPENFNVEDLLNQKLCFKSVNEIVSSQSEVFQLKVLGSSTFLALALPRQTKSGCLINLPLKGKILIQKHNKMPVNDHEGFRDNETENEINFPEEIKVRHPLIGADWKDHMNLADTIIKKSNSLKRKSKRKTEGEENQTLEENSFSYQENSARKKKKKKHSNTKD